jgi:hypothetical protein
MIKNIFSKLLIIFYLKINPTVGLYNILGNIFANLAKIFITI